MSSRRVVRRLSSSPRVVGTSERVREAAGASEAMRAALLDMDLGETEGIRIDLKGGDVAKYPLASS